MDVFIIYAWIACIFVGFLIDNRRGAVLGAVLGVIGVVAAMFLTGQEKRHNEVMEALGK